MILTGLLFLLAPISAIADINQWSGSGPFTTGLGNRVISALAVSPDGKTVYSGTGSGTVFSYTITPPTVTTNAATGITSFGATLNGTVNGNNADSAVTFEYGTTTAYGSSIGGTPATVTGAADTAVTAAITGLIPGATYHYRAVAVSTSGTTYGGDQTFNLGKTATTTVVSSSTNPSTFGQPVTFTATVTGVIVTPTGTVTFMDGSTTIGTGTLNASGQASFTTSALAGGTHWISAIYGGDSSFNISTSSVLMQTINQATSTTTLLPSLNPSTYGQPVSFTATVTSGVGTPTGMVAFMDGATAITGCSSVAVAAATATCTTSALASGTHPITAVYAGDTNFSTSTSSVLAQTVVKPPVIIKAFGAASIPLNGSTSLSFTIQNSNATTTLTGIAFSDTLPAGLIVATPYGLTGSCGGGTITATQGVGTISLTGATLAQSSSCNFSINITGTAAGTQNNTTGNVTSTEGGTGGTASASINVVAPPSIATAFGAASIPLNGSTSLTFTVTNPAANAVAETGVAFTDTLPAGLVVAAPNGLSNTCGGTATAVAGSGSISLTGGTIAASSSCTITVNVTGATTGVKSNTTGNVSSTNGGTGNKASASLAIGTAPGITSLNTTIFTIGSSGSFTITATGDPVSALGSTGALPAGVTLTDNGNGTATLAGSPAQSTVGSYPITITATNSVMPDATQIFTLTINAAAPIVTTQAASAVTATTATGNGSITATNGANATARGMIYYPYTNADLIIGDGGVANVPEAGNFAIDIFTTSLSGLSANTRYNARAYATNSAGTGYGSRVAFWTLAAVPAAPSVINTSATTLTVTINPNGNPAATKFCIREILTGKYVQAGGALATTPVWQTAAAWGTRTITVFSTLANYTFQVKARNFEDVETAFGASASAYSPTITGIAPLSGPTTGGTPVTITGTNFTGATSVTIGGAAATKASVVNATTITATTPAGTAGARDVVVTTPAGSGAGLALFTYVSASTYTVTGSILSGTGDLPVCDSPVPSGNPSTCVLKPAEGWYVAALTDNAGDVSSQVSGNQYTIASVTENHDVAVTYQEYFVRRISGAATHYHLNIQDALDNAVDNDKIRILDLLYTGDLVFDRPSQSVELEGGYVSGFTSNPGYSLLNGKLEIKNGMLILNMIELQ
jgi:hypothetical protein